AYARMGAEHGLDPYTHFPSEAFSDPVFGFLGWPFQHSPYGPLFTLGSYGLAPLGLAGAMWTVKALAAATSLAAVALVAVAATRARPPPRGACERCTDPRRPRRGRADRLRDARAGVPRRAVRAAAAGGDAQHPGRDRAPGRPVGDAVLVAAPVSGRVRERARG